MQSAHVAQFGSERLVANEKVLGSNPSMGSNIN